MEIRALRPSDDRSGFRSGDPDLDSFLQKYAGQNQFRHHIGTTYVAVEHDRVLGYTTVAPGNIDTDRLPRSLQRKLPNYPVPILRLGRPAVDSSAQRLGIGRALLKFALTLALKMADEYGCAGVLVDAVPVAADFYRRLGFTPLELLEGQSPSRPAPIPMFLSIGEIKAAGSSR